MENMAKHIKMGRKDLKRFCRYENNCRDLRPADGERKDPKMAKQHSLQVYKILTMIDP